MSNSLTIPAPIKYTSTYLNSYIMKNGRIYCFRCAEKEINKILVVRLLWHSLDSETRCDCCQKKIVNVM